MKRRKNWGRETYEHVTDFSRLISETKSKQLPWNRIDNKFVGTQFNLYLEDYTIELCKIFENRNDYSISYKVKYRNMEREFKYSSEDGGKDDVKFLFENVLKCIENVNA